MPSIMELEEKVNHLKILDEESYTIFNRIFSIYSGIGTMKIPSDLKSSVISHFAAKNSAGDIIEGQDDVIKRVQEQQIIRTFNRCTNEGALFNHLRVSRPGMGKADALNEKKQLESLINDSKENCDFCHPEKYTPSDIFELSTIPPGRIKGKHSITAANIAKYDVWSSLVIFNNHNPLEFNFEELSDHFDTAFQWFKQVFEEDPTYSFPFFVWNCLYKAGASQIHGHAQILMTRDIPYAKIESLHQTQMKYQKENKSSYFDDLFKVHEIIGLGVEMDDVRLYASLTPTKEKEIIILSTRSPFENENENIKKVIYNVLRCFIDVLEVYSFNLAIYCPPMNNEYKFPYVIKIVDRGNIFRPTADMGGMELFGSAVVADDPYTIIHHLQEYFKEQ